MVSRFSKSAMVAGNLILPPHYFHRRTPIDKSQKCFVNELLSNQSSACKKPFATKTGRSPFDRILSSHARQSVVSGRSLRESHLSQWDRAALPARSLWERSDGVRPGEGKNWITVLRFNPLPRLRLDLSRLGTVKTDSPHAGEVTCITSQPIREPAQVCGANLPQ